ncbi:MAG: hypothetical protein PHT58_07730 [Eubacteriales bacterium]|nr:hypothetical protein [Eubacteriales bacterium]
MGNKPCNLYSFDELTEQTPRTQSNANGKTAKKYPCWQATDHNYRRNDD